MLEEKIKEILEPALRRAYCEGRANNVYREKEVSPDVAKQIVALLSKVDKKGLVDIEEFFIKPIDYDNPIVEEELAIADEVRKAQLLACEIRHQKEKAEIFESMERLLVGDTGMINRGYIEALKSKMEADKKCPKDGTTKNEWMGLRAIAQAQLEYCERQAENTVQMMVEITPSIATHLLYTQFVNNTCAICEPIIAKLKQKAEGK